MPFILIPILALLASTASRPPPPVSIRAAVEERLRVREESGPQEARFVAENRSLAPAVFRLELSEVRNAAVGTAPGPVVRVLPAGGREVLLTLRPADPARPLAYRSSWRACFGDPAARHDDGYLYPPPFDPAHPRMVILAPGGGPTHSGLERYAWDFAMPVGTPVLAARAGLVVLALDGFALGGAEDWLLGTGNIVTVMHDDGTFADYLHLRHHGVRVREGDRVEAGQVLAESGMTGYAAEPHLHFAVWKANGEGREETLPVRFEGGGPGGFVPGPGGLLPPRPPVTVPIPAGGPSPYAVPMGP